ncbi:putative disease resistance protein RGA4 [Lolium perenne]|uniref:putative disease resistance protein RGA4 n=1 Tax=Lolium perenne TaxID=4522 RepID=UPI0021EAB751|nr:putative disease resistance protein RGA1 [Lolium perenne]XP_051184883.1 putative disease resistance protein RGA1 [Lolium perenne]XP_051184884.1 putative disease resistance protein RGA1 [Lolium perenne]XP_051184885.1 putative disease resistance protein RGA1 [Lolium perenne]XP_051184886.1 putative disease resistance protein RGA1 [Lolium perenne]
MAAALGPAATLLGKVFTMLSAAPVAAYVDSLELGHNSEQIKAKLAHTRGLLHNAQVSDAGHNPGLQDLLPVLSRNADQAEDLLDELHYFQIHDKLHGTSIATTQPNLLHHGRNVLRHTATSWAAFFSCANDAHTLHFQPVIMSRKIKSVLQDMQTQCDSISDLLSSIPSSSMAVALLHRPQIGSTIMQDTLYGRRDTFEETVNRIVSCKQTVSVLPIVGPGGIGKTTFTQHLYNDARAENHFEVRVWVCVSTDFDVLKLTREILGCILATQEEGSSGAANETLNLDQLQLSIACRLKSRRFLIVLDDIWKCDGENQWKTLLAPFTKGETKGSMVLVTTRFPKVACMVKTVDPLELRGLDANDFFTFFEACIFGDFKPQDYDDELAGIAAKIANKLKGSPLAAKTVGRLLQRDLSPEHWNGVLTKHEWLKQKSDHDIMPSLKISYDYLPFDMKKCFPYFGLFPEDYRFHNSEMNLFFVVIGIADSAHQVDRNYLEELADNGFLMKQVDYNGRYYVMHDLMHELSKSVSAQECLSISDLDFRADPIPQSVRHVSITIEDRYDESFEKEMCILMGWIDIANLRTLMIFGEYEKRMAKILKECFKEINSLRVLFMTVNSSESFPHRFSKLIHLQYLKIRSPHTDKVSLPSTLSTFYHLKFLDLDDWHGNSDLPEHFSHLENLHDFCAGRELHSNIRNVGKIKHLQELKEFRVKKEIMGFELRELGALTELGGKLIICGLQHVSTKEDAVAAKLKLKKSLNELKLLWDRDRPTIGVDILDAFQPHSNLRVLTIANPGCTIGPSWLCLDICLTSLETLTLEGVSWNTLPPFCKIPNLKVLTLKRISGMHQFRCGGTPGKCFMRLRTVVFLEMPDLAEWAAEPNCHCFPSLEIIECVGCPNLHVMPFSEVFWTNLCKLYVSWCPKMSLPSMPHTSTLAELVVKGDNYQKLKIVAKRLVVRGYGGDLDFHNLGKVEDMTIKDVSHISVTDIKKLEVLKKLDIGRCDGLFPGDLDGSIVLHSVRTLSLDVSHLTSKSSAKVLNCFPALSVLKIEGSYRDDEECVMQLPSSSSMQELSFFYCKSLVLVPVENGGALQQDNSSLRSLEIRNCGKLFSRWPMGEAGGGIQHASLGGPFPASLRELYVRDEPSMKSMVMLSNLTSLTSLSLVDCNNLTVDGFNPLITVNLKELKVNRFLEVPKTGITVGAVDLLSEVARNKLMPAGYISRLEELTVDNISGLLAAPICNLLAPTLHTLKFIHDKQAESFAEKQEKALQLLTSLQILEFGWCEGLQSLPQGLHHISSLKELLVLDCPKIQLMPEKGFPISLRKLRIHPRSTEINEQIENIKRTNPDLTVPGY